MTPAVELLKKKNVPFRLHDYAHDPSSDAFGVEAADKLGLPANQVFKTLVAALSDGAFAVGIVPVAERLNLKALAKACGVKKATMADPDHVERMTGYVLGGVSPFGQKKRLTTVIDSHASTFGTIFVSGGRRGLEIEIAPADLQQVLKGQIAPLT